MKVVRSSKEERGKLSPSPAGRLLAQLKPDLWALVIFEIAFFLAYTYGMSVSSKSGAPFWIPDSVLLCALMLTRPAIWWAFIVAPLPMRLFLVVSPGLPIWFLLLAFVNDSLKALAVAYLIRRALHGQKVRFSNLGDLRTYLIVAVLLGPALSGIVGAAPWLLLGRDFWPTWPRWFLGNAIANLVCTPVLLFLAQDWRKIGTARTARYAEGLVLFLTLPFATYFAYGQAIANKGLNDPFGYLPLPFLVWAAVRFGLTGASGALSIMSVLLVAAEGATQLTLPAPGAMDNALSMQLILVVLAIPILSLAVLVDRQHRTEESLRESEERFRNVANTAPVMICGSGPDKLANFFNAGWLSFTGRTLEQELGYGWTESVHPDDIAECLATYAASFDSRQSCRIEYRLCRSDGEYRSIVCSGVPCFEPGGVFAGYIASCVDITEVKRTQEKALAGQKTESLGQLARGVAHDFNNLLGGILANTELALAACKEGLLPEEELLTVRTAAIRGGEIARQLMTYGGDGNPTFEPVDLSFLVDEMLKLLKVSISKKAILETELGEGLPAVYASPSQIRQVVMNLITNASEAIGELDGVIRVTTSLVTGAANLPPGDYLKLEVSDTGRGMTPEVQSRIFDPFFTTKRTGRGLGLAAVQGIVHSHFGAINVASSPGQGARFEMLLPCTDKPVQHIPGIVTPASVIEERSVTATVLVVEDEDTLRIAVSAMLRKQGFSVVEAAEGDAAVDLFQANEPDIVAVLLDITLPGMSGPEVLTELQRIRPDVKVILTTAYDEGTALAAVGGRQAWAFIRKPYQLSDLVNLIWKACQQKEEMSHRAISG